MGMRKRVWRPRIDGVEHIVEISHGYWSGKIEIRVDGNLVYQGIRLFNIGFHNRHNFRIYEYECTLRITNGLLGGYMYGLRVNDQLVLASQECTDCVSVDWVFKPRTIGDYLALASYVLGLMSCGILGIQLLLMVVDSALSVVMIHFVSLYFLLGALAVTAGAIAMLLHSHQQAAKKSWALKGIVLGLPMLLWFALFWVTVS